MQKDLRAKYSKIFDNGVSLIESAKVLGNVGNYASATSLLILGLEEIIKYHVFLNNTGVDKVFEEDEFSKVFWNHKTKHNLVSEFQEAMSSNFTSRFQSYVLKVATNQELNEEDLLVKSNRFKEWGNILSGAFRHTKLSEPEIVNFRNWLRNANMLKNKGFYVSFKDDHWSFPDEITQYDFEEALKYVMAVKGQIEIVKSLDFTDDEFIDYLNSDINQL